MKLNDFLALTEEEQTALLKAAEDHEAEIMDLTAERDSLKTENEKVNGLIAAVRSELQKTKEVNYTLARQVKREPEKDTETLIHDMFK